jgi:hypothetical protein
MSRKLLHEDDEAGPSKKKWLGLKISLNIFFCTFYGWTGFVLWLTKILKSLCGIGRFFRARPQWREIQQRRPRKVQGGHEIPNGIGKKSWGSFYSDLPLS